MSAVSVGESSLSHLSVMNTAGYGISYILLCPEANIYNLFLLSANGQRNAFPLISSQSLDLTYAPRLSGREVRM